MNRRRTARAPHRIGRLVVAGAGLVTCVLLMLVALPASDVAAGADAGRPGLDGEPARAVRREAARPRAAGCAWDATLASTAGRTNEGARDARPLEPPRPTAFADRSALALDPAADGARDGAAKSLEKTIAKLEKKLAKSEAKEAKAAGKLAEAEQLELDGQDALAAAELLPETTKKEQKAKAKAIKKANKLLAKAAKRQAKWSGVIAQQQAKQDALQDEIDELESQLTVEQLSGAPTLTLAPGGLDALDFAWDALEGAAGYELAWSATAGVDPDAADGSAAVDGTSYRLDPQDTGMFVHAVLRARAGEVVSPASNEVAALLPAWDETFAPDWADVEPLDVIALDYDPELSETGNGARLKTAVGALQPGDRLEVGAGTWSIASKWEIAKAGTAQAPIFVVAADGARPVITRPDASQNVINVGSGGPARYLCLRGFEITGGSAGVRFVDCQEVWFDRNDVHGTGEAALTANQVDTDRMFITRNHLHDTSGYGEGMYLGANNGAVIMSRAVIALNHVHDTGGLQGDGIELKQGSWGNRIVGNFIHDTHYPCLLVYGTDGAERNLIERNVLMRSQDNTLQVQGEAIVRDNLIVGGNVGVHSHDHQGLTRDLELVHNTIVNDGKATNLTSWNGREGMVCANNVVYSGTNKSLNFTGGSSGVAIAGNVVVGQVVGATTGFVQGVGLADFVDLLWEGGAYEAVPAAGAAMLGAGDASYATGVDLLGNARGQSVTAGCIDAP
ncbi:MAG: right-handed parallel beta-helix repeat-containing protein [Planctomycetes bacterium]|nr:right-handed parallel beta-helix repeat-containing protein [Planctomycetota bacterium]